MERCGLSLGNGVEPVQPQEWARHAVGLENPAFSSLPHSVCTPWTLCLRFYCLFPGVETLLFIHLETSKDYGEGGP